MRPKSPSSPFGVQEEDKDDDIDDFLDDASEVSSQRGRTDTMMTDNRDTMLEMYNEENMEIDELF